MKAPWRPVLFLSLWIIPTLHYSCKRQVPLEDSEQKNLVHQRTSRNIAVILGAPQSGRSNWLWTISREVRLAESLLREFFELDTVTKNGVTKSEITEILRDALEGIGDRGTLVFYMAAHGIEGLPCILPEECSKVDDFFCSEDLINLAESTQRKRFLFAKEPARKKRLVLMINSCHSGHWVDGLRSVIVANESSGKPIFSEVVVMTSAQATEKAERLHFIESLSDSARYFARGKSDATLESFILKAKETLARLSNGRQTLQFSASPSQILARPLFP